MRRGALRTGVRMLLLWLWLLALPLPVLGKPTDPQAYVRQVTEQVLALIEAKRDAFRHDRPALYRAIEQVVVPHFDVPTMSRWVLGKYWRRLSADERQRFMRNFEYLLIRTYSTALLEYEDQRIEYLPLRWDGHAGRAVVRTRIVPREGDAIPVDYTLRWRDGDWKVVDVKIDGISLVANYRSTFGAEIRSKGIDGLLTRLEARVQESGQGGDGSGAGSGGSDGGG